MKPSYSVRQKRMSTTPPPNSSSSAIRAWVKRAWAGGWRTASSRNMPPRTVSSSGQSPNSVSSARMAPSAKPCCGIWRVSMYYRQIHSHLSGERRRRAGAVRPKQPSRSAQRRAVLAGAAQGQGANFRPRCWSARGGSRRARALTAGTSISSASVTASKAAISAPAP